MRGGNKDIERGNVRKSWKVYCNKRWNKAGIQGMERKDGERQSEEGDAGRSSMRKKRTLRCSVRKETTM